MIRVSLVRNNMYESYLQKSTQRLQDEIQHRMKLYSVEKQQLLKQLATLRHNMADMKISDNGGKLPDITGSPRVTDGAKVSDNGANRTGYGHTHLPDIKPSAHDKDESEDDYDVDHGLFRCDSELTSETEKGDTLHDDVPDLGIKPEKKNKTKLKVEILTTLPQIKEEPQRPLWDSGRSYQSEKQRDHSSLTALPQIQTIKDLSETTVDIPAVNDPTRTEISIPTKPWTKKVHFGSNTYMEKNDDTKRLPQIQKSKPKQMLEKKRMKHHLPPIKDVRVPTSKETEEWKSVYVNIHDPVQRTKTLGDILYAVRLRMRENEQHLMYGETAVEDRRDNTLCDYLLTHKDDKEGIRRTKKKVNQFKKSHYPSHTAERMHRRSTAVQLQNYLKKLSRQRRMIEHLEGEEYRLTHIVGHRHLREAAQKSVQ